jgi:DNA-binding response OmpR family regulator
MISILKKYTILYVEDEPEIQANIAEYLGNFFADIHLAADGKEALDQYYKHHPDVILLDINLPIIDGLNVAKQIRVKDNDVKIIMLTAFTEKEKLLKATELKLTKYLIKPVAPKVFKQTLENLSYELMNNPTRFINLSDTYTWDKEREQLTCDDQPVSLTEKEHRLLKLFLNNKSKSVSYEKIMVAVWEDAFERDISLDSVKNQVSQLRKKLPKSCISNVYGEGYVLK